MKQALLPRLFLLCAALLLLTSCARSAQQTEAEATPTLQATATPEVTPTLEPTPAPELSQAEQAKLRKPAIDAAMARLELPQEGELVARVNGVGITVDEYRPFLRLRLDSLAAQYQINWDDEEAQPLLSEVQAQTLEQLIDMELVRQQAEADQIYVDAVEVAGFTRDVQMSVVEVLGYASWEEYKETLELTDEAFERIVRQSLLLDQMVGRQPIEEQVEQVHARHILVQDQALAEEILGRLQAGEDFGELAATHSQDAYSAQRGGDLGWFPRGVMAPEFEEAAFLLEPGETSPIVISEHGLHIIEVLDKGIRPLDAVYAAHMRQVAFFEWLEGLRQNAEIERFVLDPVG